jgi:quercetin dioxygenase-like cupin family protein
MTKAMVKMEGAEKEELKARALHVQELISYQPGAVVSRTVLDKKAGTITVFSFDEGEGLSEHTAPYDATVLILDGEVEINIAGIPIRAKAGEMVIMPGGQPHGLRAITPFKMMLIMIRAE